MTALRAAIYRWAVDLHGVRGALTYYAGCCDEERHQTFGDYNGCLSLLALEYDPISCSDLAYTIGLPPFNLTSLSSLISPMSCSDLTNTIGLPPFNLASLAPCLVCVQN